MIWFLAVLLSLISDLLAFEIPKIPASIYYANGLRKTLETKKSYCHHKEIWDSTIRDLTEHPEWAVVLKVCHVKTQQKGNLNLIEYYYQVVARPIESYTWEDSGGTHRLIVLDRVITTSIRFK